jgi:hypothetical protein
MMSDSEKFEMEIDPEDLKEMDRIAEEHKQRRQAARQKERQDSRYDRCQ